MTFRKWRFPTTNKRCGLSGPHRSVQHRIRSRGIIGIMECLGLEGVFNIHLIPTSWLDLLNPLKPGHGYCHWIAFRSIFHQLTLDLTKLFTNRIFLYRANKRKKGNLEALWVGRKGKWIWQHSFTLASCNYNSSGAGREWGVRPGIMQTHRIHLSGETSEFCLSLSCCWVFLEMG